MLANLVRRTSYKKFEEPSSSPGLQKQDLNTPLLNSILQGDLTKVQYFLKEGADVNNTSQTGLTPLLIAIKSERSSIIDCLLDHHKIDVNAKNNLGIDALYQTYFLSAEESRKATSDTTGPKNTFFEQTAAKLIKKGATSDNADLETFMQGYCKKNGKLEDYDKLFKEEKEAYSQWCKSIDLNQTDPELSTRELNIRGNFVQSCVLGEQSSDCVSRSVCRI